MSGFRLALPPQLPTARAATNGTIATYGNGQGHPDKFPCIECSSHFTNAASRATHMRTAHTIEDGFLCHECVSSYCDQAQYTRHVNDHFRSRFSPPQRTCPNLKCDYQSSSTDVLERHRRDDHLCDGSHQAQCPTCAYGNDSIVGVSVHMLHVHSKEGAAKRKEALQLKRETDAAAKKAARAAKLARIEERRAAANSSSSNTASSPAETAQDSESSLPAATSSRKRSRADSPRMTAEEQWRRDAEAQNSNEFLESQMAVYNAMTKDEREEAMTRHGDRKRLKKARAREAGSS
ncbi:hypothetical protein MBLNU13_g06370t1 [Cladosporium sp. NU13]